MNIGFTKHIRTIYSSRMLPLINNHFSPMLNVNTFYKYMLKYGYVKYQSATILFVA